MSHKTIRNWPRPTSEDERAAERLSAEVWSGKAPGDAVPPEELAALLAALARDTIPEPAPGASTALVQALSREMSVDDPSRRRGADPGAPTPLATLLDILAAIRPQIGLFRPVFWGLSAFLFILGTLAASATGGGLPAAAVAALVGVLGIAYAMRSASARALEIELACPIDPVSLVSARSLLVLGYDSLLALLLLAVSRVDGLAPLVGLDGSAVVVTLRLIGPLLFFAALTLLATVAVGPGLGLTASLGAWGGLLVLGRIHPNLNVFLATGWPLGAALAAAGALLGWLAVRHSGRLAAIAVARGTGRR